MSSLRETDSIVFHWVNPIPRGEDFGIIAEPYFDVDFDEVFYLTDTGRSWNNSNASIRDKVEGTEVRGRRSEVRKGQRSDISGRKTEDSLREDEKVRRLERGKGFGDLRFRHTWDIIEAAKRGLLPDKIMINVHPQRWTDNPVEWTRELVWQNVKNVVKRIVVRRLHR